jgi:hypothetical protein
MSTQRDASPERTKSDVVYMVCRVNTPRGVFATRSDARNFLKNRITNKKSAEKWKRVSDDCWVRSMDTYSEKYEITEWSVREY